jgi:hypothetical protein
MTSSNEPVETRRHSTKRTQSLEVDLNKNFDSKIFDNPTTSQLISTAIKSSTHKITVTFPQQFQDEYSRNNKSSGVKNIRCFPECTTSVHTIQGFCGQPLIVRCTSTRLVVEKKEKA